MTETATDRAPATSLSSKSEQAYQTVKARIVEGTYTPGYRLVLGTIARDLGFSVVPIREAIRRLEAEGLVKFERNVGATVAGIDPTEYLYTMQTLSIVEGAATALSAPLIDAVAIARARAVNAEMRDCLQHFDPVRFTRLNQDFHSVLFEHCPNPHILAWSTAAGTGSHHCGPPPSALSRAGPAPQWTNTRPCSGSFNPAPTPTPSKKQPASTAAPPWTLPRPIQLAPRQQLGPQR